MRLGYNSQTPKEENLVKIKLERVGKKNRPYFRLIVQDAKFSTKGKILDILGYYDPLREGEFMVKLNKVEEWLARGAQMTPRAKSLVKLAKKKMEGMSTSLTMPNKEEV